MLDIRRFGAAFIVALALAGCGKSAGSVDDKLPENTSYKLAVMSFNVRNSLAKGDTGDKQWSNRREGGSEEDDRRDRSGHNRNAGGIG